MARSIASERDPATVCREVAISQETRDDLEQFAQTVRHNYPINAGMLRKIVAHWDANPVETVSEDAV